VGIARYVSPGQPIFKYAYDDLGDVESLIKEISSSLDIPFFLSTTSTKNPGSLVVRFSRALSAHEEACLNAKAAKYAATKQLAKSDTYISPFTGKIT
jgi:hypothetical protein